MRERFIDKDFDEESMEVLRWANAALESYRVQGYRVSQRQLFYYGVSRNLIWNTEASYGRLGRIVTDGRMAGYLDWSDVVDRNRSTIDHQYWDDPKTAMKAAIESFRTDKWEDQPCHVEVFLEKAALEGVLLPICQSLEVPFTASRGFGSASIMYETGKRLQSQFLRGKALHVMAIFDMDPSGMSMTQDIQNRLRMFSDGSPVNVHRLALNMDQVEKYHLPENPVKLADSRSSSYISRFGTHCWEVDAIPTDVLATILSDGIRCFRDEALWAAATDRQEALRERMYDEIS